MDRRTRRTVDLWNRGGGGGGGGGGGKLSKILVLALCHHWHRTRLKVTPEIHSLASTA